MMVAEQKYEPTIDIIRFLAAYFVIAGHFFVLYTGLLHSAVNNVSVFIQATLAQFLMISVPLFLIISGYFNTNCEYSGKFFKKVWRVLVPYALFSVLSIIYRTVIASESISLFDAVKMILAFNAFPYGWYIEMWIGLFLLSPILNKSYSALKSKKEKHIVLLVFLIIGILPRWINRHDVHLVPGLWEQCWPLYYYFIGKYIREFKPQSQKWHFTIIVLLCASNPLVNLIIGTDHLLLLGGGTEGLLSAIIAPLFFVSLYSTQSRISLPNYRFLSRIPLSIYLSCWIADCIWYPIFFDHFFVSQEHSGLLLFIPVTITIFISSLAVALAFEGLCFLFDKLIHGVILR